MARRKKKPTFTLVAEVQIPDLPEFDFDQDFPKGSRILNPGTRMAFTGAVEDSILSATLLVVSLIDSDVGGDKLVELLGEQNLEVTLGQYDYYLKTTELTNWVTAHVRDLTEDKDRPDGKLQALNAFWIQGMREGLDADWSIRHYGAEHKESWGSKTHFLFPDTQKLRSLLG